jgi:peptidoglycan/xylan/chitin deacetylase (PgdA/CDA1 family)
MRTRFFHFASRLGLSRILESLPARPGLVVLNYHRVGYADSSPYDRGVFDRTPEQFEEELVYLKDRFPVAELAEVEDFVRRPARLRRFHVLLTFDDGYRDSYDVVFPLLRAHGLPGTFFLPTSFVGTNRVPWWDQIAFLVRHSRWSRVQSDYPHPWEVDIPGAGVERAIRTVLRRYKDPQMTDPRRFLAALANACGVDVPTEASRPLFLDWDQAARMARAGMSFGSHTHRHELLSKLPEAEQEEELRGSRRILSERLGIAVRALAYPVGSFTSFSATTQRLAAASGYTLAFSYYGGVNTPEGLSPLNLRRMAVWPELTAPSFRLRTAVAGAIARQLL